MHVVIAAVAAVVVVVVVVVGGGAVVVVVVTVMLCIEMSPTSQQHQTVVVTEVVFVVIVAVVVKVKRKVFPEPYGPQGGADLHFLRPQPDTSFYNCETTDTGPVKSDTLPLDYRATQLTTKRSFIVSKVEEYGQIAQR